MKDKDRIWNLIAKKLANEASDEELADLSQLLQKHPEAGFSMELLNDLWQQPEKNDPAETEKAFAGLLQRLAQEEPQEQPARPFTWSNPGKKERLLSTLTGNGMLGGYFKIAWRNLTRSKVFSIINITGLAIGMAGAILILLWIQNELSFDRFHKNKDRIYKIYNSAVYNGKIETWGNTPMVMTPVLQQYPEVEAITRVNWVAAFVLKTNEKQLQPQGYLTDPGFLKMFDFPLVKGNAATALDEPHSIVITENLAQKLFGSTDPLGKVLRIDSNALFTVTGVMKNLPNNTQFKFEYLVPFSYMKEVGWDNDNWDFSSTIQTYVLLKPGVTEKMANAQIRDVIKTHDKRLSNTIFLHPMRKWHLWSHFENGKITGGEINGVRLMSIIATFILLIACINYMNLSTARSVKRAREVGIRKVAGAGKSALIGQFIGESIMIAFIAGLFSLAIATYSLPWFNQLTFKELSIPFSDYYFWLTGIAFILITGLLAGSYPAFYLSSFKPVAVLKGSFKAVHTLITPRKVLVVLQFTFAIVLIICTIVVYRQIAYGQKRETGFKMNDLVFVYNLGDLAKNYKLIREDLMHSGAVTSMVRTGSPVIDIWTDGLDLQWQGKDPNNKIYFIKFYTDKDFVKTMGLRIVAGRDIDIEKYPTDSTAVLLNESALHTIGFKDPIGQTITNNQGIWHVVGVVNNFVPGLPWDPVYPMVIQGPGIGGWFGTLTFRLNDRYSESKNIAAIGSVLKKYNPDYPFDYYFVSEMYAGRFKQEINTGQLAGASAGLTIFISCLGLFALAAYMAENRIKEISIRKVLGASIAAITTLLSKDFLKLVLFAFVIASPVAWLTMHHWLQQYSYRVSISWWIFVVTGSVTLLIAMLTVSYQAIKAALANPARSLRNE